jgi:hypothetical protein
MMAISSIRPQPKIEETQTLYLYLKKKTSSSKSFEIVHVPKILWQSSR